MKSIQTVLAMLFTAVITSAFGADQPYPAKEIKFIVPWAPGGSTDIATRMLAQLVAEDSFRLIVENAPGNTGQIGLGRVAKAAPDGYTLGMGTSSTLILASQRMTDLKIEQFTSIANASTDPLVLLVPTPGPDTVEAFIEYMKRNPGKVSIGTPGSNNTNHIFSIMTARAAGVDFINVPYPGGARVITDLAGKQIDAAVLKPSESRSQISAGKVKALAVYSDQRLSFYPDVPTMKEKGYYVFPYGPVVQMSYVVAPAGLPAPIKDKIIAVFRKAIASTKYKAFADQSGFFVEELIGADLESKLVSMQKASDSIAMKVFKTN